MSDRRDTYAQRYYRAALDFFESGKYEKALEHIDKAIASQPKNADYLSTRGVFLHKMNDLTGAIDTYRKSIAINPNNTFARFNLGLILMKMGHIADAVQEWEAVVKADPRDVDALFNIAVALTQLGRCKESIPFYEKVLEITPNHIQAHQNLGILYRDEKQFAKAKYHLRMLRDLDSTYTEVVETELLKCDEQEFLSNIASRTEQTISEELANSTAKKYTDVLSEALSALIEKNYEQSLKLAEEYLAVSPGDELASMVKGQALAHLNRKEEAIALFTSLTHNHPDCVEAYFYLGNLFLGLNRLSDALEAFERVRRLDPTFPSIEWNIQSLRTRLSAETLKAKE